MELKDLLRILRENLVEEFEGDGIKVKFQAGSAILPPQPLETKKDEAQSEDEDLFYSTPFGAKK